MKRKSARRFVVGYSQRGQTIVYGKGRFLSSDDLESRTGDFCMRMTLREARNAMKVLSRGRTVYELIPVELPK